MTERPLVTVVMPVRNESDFIARSLGAVITQDYPPDRFEIIIADGMSTDRTRSLIAEQIAANPQVAISLIDNPGRIVPTGLNLAIRRARGEIIVRIDGHCEIAPDYVSRCVEHLLKGEVEGVGGPIETIGNTPLSQTIAIAMSSAFGVGGSAFRTIRDRAMLVDTIAFAAYRRETLDKAGPFDEELVRNQDDEYNYRLRGIGCKLLLTPDVRSRYYSRSSLRSLWRQYFQYGVYKVRVMQKHPLQMRPRQFIPPIFVAVLLGGAVGALSSPLIRLLWLLTLGLYIAANLAASVRLASAQGWEHVPRLPIIFAILHISYGLGFFAGLIRFRGRWRAGRQSP